MLDIAKTLYFWQQAECVAATIRVRMSEVIRKFSNDIKSWTAYFFRHDEKCIIRNSRKLDKVDFRANRISMK